MHGKTSLDSPRRHGVFAGLPSPLEATRYHSLVIEPDMVANCLRVTATTDDGIIMGVRHRELPVEGVQFHPESILTIAGHDLITKVFEHALRSKRLRLRPSCCCRWSSSPGRRRRGRRRRCRRGWHGCWRSCRWRHRGRRRQGFTNDNANGTNRNPPA